MRNYKPATFQPTIRPDWAGVLSYLSDKEKGEILVALFKYPSVECKSAFWLETIKPDLDMQYSEFQRVCAEKSRGVRNRWGKISITDVNISNTDVIDSEREREEEQEKECSRKYTSSKSYTHVNPTEQEVLDYAKQQDDMAGVGGFAVSQQEAQAFYDYYSGIGWVVSNDARTPIVDWKPFLRKWAKNPRFKNRESDTVDINDPDHFLI